MDDLAELQDGEIEVLQCMSRLSRSLWVVWVLIVRWSSSWIRMKQSSWMISRRLLARPLGR